MRVETAGAKKEGAFFGDPQPHVGHGTCCSDEQIDAPPVVMAVGPEQRFGLCSDPSPWRTGRNGLRQGHSLKGTLWHGHPW